MPPNAQKCLTAVKLGAEIAELYASELAIANDATAPTVSLASPAGSATVAGSVGVAIAASDDVSLAGVQLLVDGMAAGPELTVPPFTHVWETTAVADGAHTLVAVARDAAGNESASAIVSVTVDNQPPTVVLTAPTPGAAVSGTVNVSASATDNLAVAGVLFQVNGESLGSEDTAPPYSVAWDTTALATGTHVLTAVVRDRAGNVSVSPAESVAVSRYTFVTLASPARVEARDLAGRRVAVFTVGAHSVASEGPLHTLAEQTPMDPTLRTVSHTTWIRLLEAPFDGSVDAHWLDQALIDNQDRVPDILEIAVQYIHAAPPLWSGALQIAGDAHYGPLQPDGTRAEGADFHDYLGLSWMFHEQSGDVARAADADQLQSLDCSGFTRMVFGYRGGIALSFNVQPGNMTIPRRANELFTSAPGVVVIPNVGTQSTAYHLLQPGDTIFWDSDAADGPRLDHVGIYLGVDPQGYHRFISSRKSANGPTMGDYVARSVLNRTGIYTTSFRAARRL